MQQEQMHFAIFEIVHPLTQNLISFASIARKKPGKYITCVYVVSLCQIHQTRCTYLVCPVGSLKFTNGLSKLFFAMIDSVLYLIIYYVPVKTHHAGISLIQRRVF